MLVEHGTIVEVSDDALLVEVIQSGTCGTCAMQRGCGQGVLARYLASSHHVRVAILKSGHRTFSVGEQLELGIDEYAMVRAALLVYLVPVLCLVGGSLVGGLHSEPVSIVLAIVGVLASGCCVRFFNRKKADDPAYSPVVVDDHAILRVLSP